VDHHLAREKVDVVFVDDDPLAVTLYDWCDAGTKVAVTDLGVEYVLVHNFLPRWFRETEDVAVVE